MTSLVKRELTRRTIAKERARRAEAVPPTLPAGTALSITKADKDKRLVFGFAKFSEDPDNRGSYYVDRQGDVIEIEELEKSAYDFVLTSRDGGTMHQTGGDATLIESFMVTPEKLQKMGLAEDALPAGWWTGFYVHPVEAGQPDPWDKITKGEYTAFSIEGEGRRIPIDKMDDADDEYAPNINVMSPDLEQEVARRSIREMVRNNAISPEEGDQMLRNLVESPKALSEDKPEQFPEAKLTPSMISEFVALFKHAGKDHPESAHGNRLYSDEAEQVGDLMKKLKTRFKRTDAATLRALQKKFSQASGEKATLNHDQVVAELARRNVLPVKSIKFRSTKFQNLKDEIMAAITAEMGEV
jgi:hypothetical protein